MHHTDSERKCFGLYEANPYSAAFEAFNHSSIFDEAVFCLGEKQGMLINDECVHVCHTPKTNAIAKRHILHKGEGGGQTALHRLLLEQFQCD